MKRILIITQQFPPEKFGNASRIYDLAKYLVKAGSHVTVIAPHPSFPFGGFKKEHSWIRMKDVEGIQLINILSVQPSKNDPDFITRMLYYLLFPIHASLWSILKRNDFDVIITSSPPLFTFIPGLFTKKIMNKFWVLDIRDLWIDASVGLGFLEEGELYERLSRKFERICINRCDLISVTTNELGIRLNLKEENKAKIVHIPNGVDTAEFNTSKNEKKNWIVYAGNVGHAQDLEKVILSMKEVTKHHDVELRIIGDGDTKQKLMKLVDDEGLKSNVIFEGIVPREKIPEIISNSLLGLAPLKKLPSLEYAAPTKTYEYMAGGIPFIGCGRGEIELIASESGAGIIADNDVQDIASKIIFLLDNPSMAFNMGAYGRQYVEVKFDRRTIAERLLQSVEFL